MASFWKTCLKQKLKRVTTARRLNAVTHFLNSKQRCEREKVLIPEKKATT